MQIIENLVEDDELDSIIERLVFLRRNSQGFLDKWFFWRVMRDYRNLRRKMKKLNGRTARFNFERQLDNYDADGTSLGEIKNEKKNIAGDAQRILEVIREYIVKNRFEERYGKIFTRRVARYEEIAIPFQEYLQQEAMSSNAKPASGMIKVMRARMREMEE